MRTIFLLLFVVSVTCFSQEKHSDTDFYLLDKEVYWMHVYENDSLKKDELIKYFQKEVLTNIKQDNFQIIDNTISFKINDDKVDFKKYGGTSMGTAFIAQLYLTYLVVIDFKDYRYKVTIKDIFLDNKAIGSGSLTGEFHEFVLKNKNTEFLKSNTITKGLIYDHKHFLEKFTINKSKDSNW